MVFPTEHLQIPDFLVTFQYTIPRHLPQAAITGFHLFQFYEIKSMDCNLEHIRKGRTLDPQPSFCDHEGQG